MAVLRESGEPEELGPLFGLEVPRLGVDREPERRERRAKAAPKRRPAAICGRDEPPVRIVQSRRVHFLRSHEATPSPPTRKKIGPDRTQAQTPNAATRRSSRSLRHAVSAVGLPKPSALAPRSRGAAFEADKASGRSKVLARRPPPRRRRALSFGLGAHELLRRRRPDVHGPILSAMDAHPLVGGHGFAQ
jgi:hypothetical protein